MKLRYVISLPVVTALSFALQIFEKSAFATEVGAALMITPNGARVLSRLGFSFTRARAVQMDRWTVLRGDNNDQMASVDLSAAEEKFGAPVWAVHRVDLHNELLRLATLHSDTGRPVKMNLDSEVIGAEVEGTITLRNGSRHTADVIIGADGLRSALKDVVLPKDAKPPTPTGLSAFRFLIDTEKLKASESLSATLNKKGPGASLLADIKETTKERHIMWYACRE
jgi:salicylate hydroxylase